MRLRGSPAGYTETRGSAGSLRHRVDIQEDVSAEGADVPDWSGVFASSVPCRVTTPDGDKSERHLQVIAEADAVVIMRRRSGLRTDRHRIVHGTRLLNIERIVDREGTGRWVELWCREVAA